MINMHSSRTDKAMKKTIGVSEMERYAKAERRTDDADSKF